MFFRCRVPCTKSKGKSFILLHWTPYTYLSASYGHLTPIWVTTYGHPTRIWVTTYGHPTQIWVTIGTRILKKKLEMRVKTKFFIIFTMCIVILRSFYIMYVEISFHLTVPLKSVWVVVVRGWWCVNLFLVFGFWSRIRCDFSFSYHSFFLLNNVTQISQMYSNCSN